MPLFLIPLLLLLSGLYEFINGIRFRMKQNAALIEKMKQAEEEIKDFLDDSVLLFFVFQELGVFFLRNRSGFFLFRFAAVFFHGDTLLICACCGQISLFNFS